MDTQDAINSREGAALLGTNQPNFLYYVRIGDIATKEEKSARGGKLYSRADTMKVKKLLVEKARAKRATPAPVIIDWVFAADLPANLALTQAVYHEEVDIGEIAIYQAWRKHNQNLTLGAFSLDRKECYALISLIPISEQIALDVLSGQRMESSIEANEIRAYDQPGGYILLGTSAIVSPGHEQLLYQLLTKYMQFWTTMYPEKWIQKIYAQTVSERGVMLAQHLFMSPRYDLATNAYELDLSRPTASRIIRKFKESLAQIAPLPTSLQWSPDIEPHTATENIRKSPAPTRPRVQTPASSTLPDGLEPFRAYASRHGISESTAQGAIARGQLQGTAGSWKAGTGIIKTAFNADQQRAFLAYYKDRPAYHQCDVPECQCHTMG